MSAIFGKKKPTCQRISQNGESAKYACETEPGKTFVVTVKADGTISPEPSFVAPTPKDYELIYRSLVEKGVHVRPQGAPVV